MIMIDRMIEQALLEDIHTGDITTKAVVPHRRPAEARLVAKEDLVVAGLAIAGRVFSHLSTEVVFSPRYTEGECIEKGTIMATLQGDAADLLMGGAGCSQPAAEDVRHCHTHFKIRSGGFWYKGSYR